MGVKGVEPSSLVFSDIIFGDQIPTVGDTPKSDVPDLNRHPWFYRPIFYLWTTLFLGQKGIEPLYDRHERSVLTIKLQALSGLESYSNEYSYKNKIRQKHKKRAEQRIERVVLKYMG